MNRTRSWSLVASILLVGCGHEPDVPVSTTSSPAIEEEGPARNETIQRGIAVGTHALGEEEQTSFIPVDSGDSIPIVYGPQGAYMVILALELDEWTSPEVTISVSIFSDGAVVASLFYPDLSVAGTPPYAPNLFVITNGWEEYTEQEITLEVLVSGEQESGEVSFPITLLEPASLYGP